MGCLNILIYHIFRECFPISYCFLLMLCIFYCFFLFDTFDRLPMLKSLDVSFNSILKIPEEIGSATSLVKYLSFFFLFFLFSFPLPSPFNFIKSGRFSSSLLLFLCVFMWISVSLWFLVFDISEWKTRNAKRILFASISIAITSYWLNLRWLHVFFHSVSHLFCFSSVCVGGWVGGWGGVI